jgi:hypothetical protein
MIPVVVETLVIGQPVAVYFGLRINWAERERNQEDVYGMASRYSAGCRLVSLSFMGLGVFNKAEQTKNQLWLDSAFELEALLGLIHFTFIRTYGDIPSDTLMTIHGLHHLRWSGPQYQGVHRMATRCTRHCNSIKSDTLLVTLLL